MTMRTCLALIGVLLAALPVTAQNAFFNRTTLLPVPGVNLPQPSAIFAADFNHDGLADLAVGGAGAVVILLRQASGEFIQSQSFPVQGQAAAIVAADFNQDGNLDLAVALPDSLAVAILPGASDGSFRQRVTTALAAVNSRMISIAPGDFDAEGKPDLAGCYLSGDVAVLICTGANGFRAAERPARIRASFGRAPPR